MGQKRRKNGKEIRTLKGRRCNEREAGKKGWGVIQ